MRARRAIVLAAALIATSAAELRCSRDALRSPGARSRLATAQSSPIEPALFPRGGGPIVVDGELGDDARCESCHADVAREWRSSMHARAGTDPVFVAEHRGRPDPTCVRCHAPAVAEGGTLADVRASVGVSCTTCHVRDGAVLAARPPSGRAPHPSRADARLANTVACAECHQFRFPAPSTAGEAHFDPAGAQQDTIAEWSSVRDRVPCQRCHMPTIDRGGRVGASHAFPGLGDPELVRSALDVRVRARRERAGVLVTVTLRAAAVAHAVPTGDLFRRLRVEARAGVVTTFEDLRRYFGAELDGDRFVVRERDDTRVPPPGHGARTVRLRLAVPPSVHEVAWSITLLRLDPEIAAARSLDPAFVAIDVEQGTARVAP